MSRFRTMPLLPAAYKYGEAHLAIVGIAFGMIAMAASLIILRY